jgi:glucose/arabinose dehydrogenase
MVGLALDPDFARNGYVYIDHLDSATQRCKITRLTASRANPDVMEPGSEVVLLDSITEGGYTGGALTFGKDGMLYIGSAHGRSQDSTVLMGKALRIDPRAFPDVVPPDNPFVGRARVRPEIWAFGFREPFTGTTDTVTGNIVFNDVGGAGFEEVDLIKKGANYGSEGGCEGNCTKPGMENPWINLPQNQSLGPNGAAVITGGAFYWGKSFPVEYRGAYFYSDWGFQQISYKPLTGPPVLFDKTQDQVIQLEVGPVDGALYALKIEGQNPPWKGTIQRIRYTGPIQVTPYEVGRLGRIGPESAIWDRATRGTARFFLGTEPVLHARVRLLAPDGRQAGSFDARPGDRDLDLNLRGFTGQGAFLYTLEGRSRGGADFQKQGRVMVR